MAVAGHVFDQDPAPPLLVQAWDYERYHVDILEMHPGTFRALRLAGNAYGALAGYQHAVGRTVAWSQQNPQAWEFVSSVIAARKAYRRARKEGFSG